jgi:L-threonine kinase
MNFLVTCPITVYSQVSVNLAAANDDSLQVPEKTREAVRRTLNHLALPLQNIEIRVDSQLPLGKGMASSSADISAACLATALAAGREIDIDAICDIALEIEPTDGIFLPGITLIDHVSGSIRRALGHPPAIHIAIFDVGGEVDTIDFNHRSDLAELNRAKEPQVLKALQMVETGLLKGDCSLIGEGATLSALANQSILFKPSLEGIIELAVSFGAVGVNVAHSGTVIGVMFDPSIDSLVIDDCITAICRKFDEICYLRTARLTSGGLSIVEAPEYVG